MGRGPVKENKGMSENKMAASYRKEFGKGAARKLRAAGHIPAVIYGHGEDPTHVSLPGHETTLLVRKANALIDLTIEGDDKLVLVKDVQRDPVRQVIEHLDLVVIRKGEKVTVDVAIHVEGEPFSGTMVQLESQTVSLEAEAINIPEFIAVSVDGLEEGTQILAGALQMPQGSTLLTDPEALVLAITLPAKADEAVAGDEAAEGDGAEAGEAGESAGAGSAEATDASAEASDSEE
jgi:large subunit ribosomal protein L25